MHEFHWISSYFAPLAHPDFALSLRDDAALLTVPSGMQLVISTDTLNEQVHFLPHTPAELIASKALAVNLSDMAAMGANPLAYSLALSLPRDTTEDWIAVFADGLADMQQQHGIHLLGGDTTATQGPLSLTITAYGLCETGNALRRSGAQTGDDIYVSGTIGDGMIGLAMAQHGIMHPLRTRYEQPTPRIGLGKRLCGIATACMDISDGLLQDLRHLCTASHAGAQVDLARLPVSCDAQEWIKTEGLSLTDLACGGDDYELLFTAPESAQNTLAQIAQQEGGSLTMIGKITEAGIWAIRDEHGNSISPSTLGYQHF